MSSEEAGGKSGGPYFEVIVIDMFDYSREGQQLVKGFASFESAREYARRRTRASVEEQRPGSSSPDELSNLWYMFGEDCVVVGGNYTGVSELDFFIAHPATAEERDWLPLTPTLNG